MTTAEIARLEQASRSVMAYEPDAVDVDRTFGGYLLGAAPVLSLIAVAAALVFILA